MVASRYEIYLLIVLENINSKINFLSRRGHNIIYVLCFNDVQHTHPYSFRVLASCNRDSKLTLRKCKPTSVMIDEKVLIRVWQSVVLAK